MPGTLSPRIVVSARCTSCRRALALECEGVPAYSGYQTYNEYICPHCHKKNVERTPGAIASVSVSD